MPRPRQTPRPRQISALLRGLPGPHRLSLALKLPALMIAIALGCFAVAGAVAFDAARTQARHAAMQRLTMLAQTRAAMVEDWGRGMLAALETAATDPAVIEAARSFLTAHRGLGNDANAHLRRSFIADNPNPAAERANLLSAPEETAYARFHERFHPALRARAQGLGLRDLFIVSAGGDLIYSVRKQEGFGSNVAAAGGGLAAALRAAQGPGARIGFSDYAEVGAAGGPVAYLAAPLHGTGGESQAVLLFELDSQPLAHLVGAASGRGELTEVLLQAADLTLHSGGAAQAAVQNPASPASRSELMPGTEGITELTLPSDSRGIATFQPVGFAGAQWRILAAEPAQVLSAAPQEMLDRLARAGLAALAITLLLAFFAARQLVLPLRRLAQALHRTGSDKAAGDIPARHRRDEIGTLARALEALRNAVPPEHDEHAHRNPQAPSPHAEAPPPGDTAMQALQSALARLAEGELGNTISSQFPAEHEALRTNFNRATDRLQQAMLEVSQGAQAINRDVDHIVQASDELGQRTERQAATVEQTAAALDQLTASVSEAAKNASEVDGIVGKTREDAQASGEVVRETIEAIGVIEASFQRISNNIKVIDDIAFQTNLLALNAGVEAARAGDAGLGFAVVASEVRMLAQRCSEAASEINTQITASSDHVQNGVRLVGRTGGALKEIIESIRTIADRVSAIAESAREQSTGLSELNSAVSELDMTTQKNAAMFEETSAASSELRSTAQGLRQSVDQFTLRGDTEGWSTSADAAEPQRAASA